MINLRPLLGKKLEDDVSLFTESIRKGIYESKLPKAKRVWRVSSLVQLYKLNCPKLLYLYLVKGFEKEFCKDTLNTFNLGTKVHDLMKEYFENSPDFKIIHSELPIQHWDLPITGTPDLVIEWNKYPGREFVVEIKSCATEYVNNPTYGSRYRPFKAARWQAGIYSHIYSKITGRNVRAFVVYYDKNNGEIIPHLLPESDPDVDNILKICREVYEADPEGEEVKDDILKSLRGACKRRPHPDCHLSNLCDIFRKEGE